MKDYPRIVFMGTPDIAKDILLKLIENDYHIVLVVSQEDKPSGRKGLIKPTPTKSVALEHQIEVFQPHKIRLDYARIAQVKPDLIITCAYGQIVPQGLLDIPPLGCINVHGSLLPKYRGASPIQQALIHGDKITGVTIMEMIDQMDAGRMYYKKEVVIENDNYTSLYQKITLAGANALLEMLPSYIEKKQNKEVFGEIQDESLVTFCKKITKEEEHLSLDYDTNQFINYVAALSRTPGGYLLLDGEIFKILKCHYHNADVSHELGMIVQADKHGLILQLKDGQVALDEVQKQGRNPMDYKAFVNGNKNILFKKLG